MNGPGLGNWVAHQPAQQELGLDITEANFHIATTSNDTPQNCATEPREVPQIPDTTPSRLPSPNNHTTSPASVFHVLESLYTAPRAITPEPVTTISQLVAALNIQDNQMSTTLTTEAIAAQVGRIDPSMGHMFTTEDAARA